MLDTENQAYLRCEKSCLGSLECWPSLHTCIIISYACRSIHGKIQWSRKQTFNIAQLACTASWGAIDVDVAIMQAIKYSVIVRAQCYVNLRGNSEVIT